MSLFGRFARTFLQNVNKRTLLPLRPQMAIRFVHRPVALSPAPAPIVPNIEDLPQFGTFSPSVCQFIAERQHENSNSRIKSWVTRLADEKPVGLIDLNEFVFGENPRIDILHRVVVWQRAKRRAGTACVKGRSEVRGGGRKPWPQKGHGRARQGSIRAPQFRGGGVVHGPKPKSYAYTLPKKVRRMGLRVALSVRYAQGDLHIVESFEDIEDEKDLIPILDKRGWKSAVLVDSVPNPSLIGASEDLEKIDVFYSENVNVYSILLRHNLVLSLDAVKQLEERLVEDDRIIQNHFE
ncbi:uncharacterized protein LOC110235655 [Exaiptasia diaphana]|uniref:Large ribosomal subunit protein uL4m n=1 Tax=Exaiptasia diaphana TaxID=2652724 RepID=A0A913X016_EXADI|nr:uncharacterized protein LOC110235655 [Exaiptasia diaphana]KXJ29929.1 39S ribosomal protein L4, mitochondrial [Exaiptasia diaphana]